MTNLTSTINHDLPTYDGSYLNVNGELLTSTFCSYLLLTLENASASELVSEEQHAYDVAVRETYARLKKASSWTLAHKFEKTFGDLGVFNPWQVTREERHHLISSLAQRQLSEKFGNRRPRTGATVLLHAVKTLLGVGQASQQGRFSEDDIFTMRLERLELGTSYRKLGAKYGVSGDMARSICLGECYTDVAVSVIEVR